MEIGWNKQEIGWNKQRKWEVPAPGEMLSWRNDSTSQRKMALVLGERKFGDRIPFSQDLIS